MGLIAGRKRGELIEILGGNLGVVSGGFGKGLMVCWCCGLSC